MQSQGNCLDGQDIGGVVPTAGQALVYDGAKWNPGTPGGGGAGAVAFVFQPGGPVPAAGAAPLGNIYTTEASLWAAMNAELLVTGGTLSLEVDSTIAPAVFALPHNWQGRIVPKGANPLFLGPDTITFNALQTDVPEVAEDLIIANGVAAGPAIALTALSVIFRVGPNSALVAGTHAVLDVGAGQQVDLILEPTAGLIGGVLVAAIGLTTATSTLNTFWYGNEGLALTGLVSGVIGSTWLHIGDASWMNPDRTLFLGTFSQTPADLATGVKYSLATQPALLPLPFGTDMSAQQAIATHQSPVLGQGGDYTIDVSSLDQTINWGTAGHTLTIPAGEPVGREITNVDSSGGAGGNFVTLQPAPAESIGTGAAGAPVTYTQVQAKAFTIKKVTGTNWRVISSTTLV